MKKLGIYTNVSFIIFWIMVSWVNIYGADNEEGMFRGNSQRTAVFDDEESLISNNLVLQFKAKAPFLHLL